MYSPSISSLNPIPTALSPELGKVAQSLSGRAARIVFLICAEARGLPDLQQIHIYSHQAAELTNHARHHVIPISVLHRMSEEDICAAFHYGAHSSASKEVVFFHQEISTQVQEGHAVVSPLSAVRSIPKLWLPPVAIIPQVGLRPHFIFILPGAA